MNKKGVQGLRPYVIAIILIIFFSFFIYGFVGEFATATNPESQILDSKYGLSESHNTTRERLRTIQSNINLTSTELASAEPDPVEYIFLIARSLFEIPKTIITFTLSAIAFIPSLIFGNLGGSGAGDIAIIGLGVIFSIMVITLVLFGVKALRTGETER